MSSHRGAWLGARLSTRHLHQIEEGRVEIGHLGQALPILYLHEVSAPRDQLLPAKRPDCAVHMDGRNAERITQLCLGPRSTDIPVSYFKGTLEEAVLEAGAANSKAKLSITTQERQDYAWRLELFGRYFKAEIAAAAGVSKSQVAYMRAAKWTLSDEAFSCRSWSQARRLAAGKNAYTDMTGDEREQ